MSRAIAALHGRFGRACIYEMNRPLATHAHREGHLIFYLSGDMSRVMVSRQVVEPDAFTAAAISPLPPHNISFYDSTPQGSNLLVLYINPVWFLEIGKGTEGTLRFGQASISVNSRIEKLVSRVSNMLTDGDQFDLFNNCLHELTQACYDQSWANSTYCEIDKRMFAWNKVCDHRVQKSINLMKLRVSDEWVLDDIASEVGLSRTHFYKLFRENIGITPNVYLNTLRMERALDRLVTTDEPVTSIGLDLGFASQASFTRFFGANVGIPPTDYRRVVNVS